MLDLCECVRACCVHARALEVFTILYIVYRSDRVYVNQFWPATQTLFELLIAMSHLRNREDQKGRGDRCQALESVLGARH